MREIKTILILGGYGNAGRSIAKHLIGETLSKSSLNKKDIHIIIAGRDEKRAQEVAQQLGRQYDCPDRVSWRQVDATSTESLDKAFSSSSKQDAAVDMVVVASSTTSLAKQVAEAALRNHVDYYFDIQMSSRSKIRDLTSLEKQIQAANACFVTDGGLLPGLPGALVRYAAVTDNDNASAATTSATSGTTTAVRSANVYLVFQPNWSDYTYSSVTQKEFLHEIGKMEPLRFTNGAWENAGWKYYPTFDFGPPFGKRMVMPLYLEEMRVLQQQQQQQEQVLVTLQLQEMGFYMAGFHWCTDYVVVPLALLVLFLLPKKVSNWLDPFLTWLFQWSLVTFSKPPFGGKIVMEATIGGSSSKPPALNVDTSTSKDNSTVRLELTLDDMYEATAIPTVATILQMLDYNNDDGKAQAPSPGLHYQAQLVEPRRFLKDIERLGIDVKQETIVSET